MTLIICLISTAQQTLCENSSKSKYNASNTFFKLLKHILNIKNLFRSNIIDIYIFSHKSKRKNKFFLDFGVNRVSTYIILPV